MPTEAVPLTPFVTIGGADAVTAIVKRFYDLIDERSEFAELRALHEPDLEPTRASLRGFLAAWLGGPRDWFTERPGKCLMSAHSRIAMTPETAQQWGEAMTAAIVGAGVDSDVGSKMARALSDLARGMVRQQP